MNRFWKNEQIPNRAVHTLRFGFGMLLALLLACGIGLGWALWIRNVSLALLIVAFWAVGTFVIYRWSVARQLTFEVERGKAGRKLRLLAHAMENTMDGVMIIDAKKMRIVAVNKGFTNITGYTAEEAMGHTPRMFRSEHHDEAFYKELWRALRKEGRWRGEIWDTRKSGEKYAQLLNLSAVRVENGQVTHYVGSFNDISQYKDYESALEFLANHDPLTNLPNRILLNNRLEEAIANAGRKNGLVCLMFIDLDRFKVVNDSLGHEIGDRLLQQVAARLLAGVHPDATVARLGGDEFTIVTERIASVEDAAQIAEGLLEALLKPAHIDDHQLYISASIGVSFYPQDGTDATTLLKHADTAMYRAKEEGRDKFKFFSSDMNARAREFMMMANSLRLALDKNQLVIEYQPRVNLKSGHIVGVEALLRWDHPELGRISPQKFIPLAEETGLIVPIGEWVIRAACRQGKIWLDAGYPLHVAVNLSVRQFRKKGLVEFILNAVRDADYRPDLLEVEITESLMMDDPDAINSTLNELHEHGIKIAIDDFGTGYSSLNYLKQFPIGYVKIDQSFVRDTPGDPDSVAIVKTIIAMGKNLRLSLIAEGIENEQQRDLLCAEGCDEAQGFFYSRSVPAHDILPLLVRFNGDKSVMKEEALAGTQGD
ncbi:MAG: EAL domain-containing protein [Burkholderiales bacterium]|nr:EAL domain-containing protein [Burkholderiales bacterium]